MPQRLVARREVVAGAGRNLPRHPEEDWIARSIADVSTLRDFYPDEEMPIQMQHHMCPYCSSYAVDRIPGDHILDYIARLLGRRLYRCRNCAGRFYDRPLRATGVTPARVAWRSAPPRSD